MNISIDFHKVTAGNCFLAAFLIYKARYVKLYRIMGAVNSLFIKNSLIPLYFHPYFLPILWYNTITARKKQPFDCFFVHSLWCCIHQGCRSCFDHFEGSFIAIVEASDKIFYLGILVRAFGVKDQVRRDA